MGDIRQERKIRQVTEDDLPAIAGIHLSAFPASIFSRLGRETARRYYEWLLSGPHPHPYARLVLQDDQVAGFCFGGVYRGALYGFFKRNIGYLLIQLIIHPWLIFNPEFLKKLSGVRWMFRYFLFNNSKKTSILKTNAGQPDFGILSIAVDRTLSGSGIGKTLMQDAEEDAIRLGYQKIVLTVDVNNHRAIRFYEFLGWKRILDQEVFKGKMVRILK